MGEYATFALHEGQIPVNKRLKKNREGCNALKSSARYTYRSERYASNRFLQKVILLCTEKST